MDVVLLTPPAPGAIAVYLLAGADCRSMLRPCCGDKVLALKPGDVKRINLHDGEYVIDDALIVCTAEDICELHLHGGVALVREVAGLFRRMGANVVDPQSDAGRALAAGACGVDAYRRGIGADILAALPAARTATAVDLLAHQLEHGLAKWRTSALANLGAGSLPLWQFQSDVQWLLERSHALRFLLQPPRIAIVGPPNAGKSTLANALLGRPVSITSDIPGTTRDWVDADGVLVHTRIEIPAIFLDTAGIRATSDAIELESIRRSHDQLRQADAAIVVLDAAAPADAATLELLQAIAGDPNMPPAVIAENKCDCPVLALEVPASVGFPRRRISALTQQGIPELLKAVMELLGIADVDAKEPFAFARRQRDILRRAAVADTVEAALEILAGL